MSSLKPKNKGKKLHMVEKRLLLPLLITFFVIMAALWGGVFLVHQHYLKEHGDRIKNGVTKSLHQTIERQAKSLASIPPCVRIDVASIKN
ncbi:MAG: hypothetical protein GY834_04510 [Bacteroidetes bacterium]|nr:hypothetical protein [Bacteroidota bacterium]